MMHIRPAEEKDIAEIVALLLADAGKRQAIDPHLWDVAPDAAERIRAALATIANPMTGPIRHLWMVAERGGAVVAVIHGANLPPPPIIDLEDGTAGVLLDDSCLGEDGSVAAALIAETEKILSERGAVLFVAASPAEWTERTAMLRAAGYEDTTLYMAKSGLGSDRKGGRARAATIGDIDGIVHLSALHRARLKDANPVFWNIHGEADARFRGWMTLSLDMQDRAMFVSGEGDGLAGFIIAQPGSPLHLPPAHDVAKVGLIDDFYASAFEPGHLAAETDELADLLGAAEAAFHDRGVDIAMAICPVAMRAKADFLEAQGYRTANLWMVKA